MITSLTRAALGNYLRIQTENLFPDGSSSYNEAVVDRALERFEFCLSHIALPGYSRSGAPYFNHLHGDQYAMFLYFCSNTAWASGELELAAKYFLLNKALNGIVCMYDTLLPDIFLFNHTVGTVLGKATYAPYFVAYQGVTVGTHRQRAPVLSPGLVMYGGSSIIGACAIGEHVALSSNAAVLEQDVQSDTVVTGSSPHIVTHKRKRNLIEHYFRSPGTL